MERKVRLASLASQTAVDDATLIARVRTGDQDAMAALYDRYSPLVYAVALRALGDSSSAEDVLQEIFVQLWRNPAAFDSSRGSLAAWLGVIARNRSIDHLRRRRPEENLEEVVIAASVDLRTETERNLAIAKVRTALNGMPAEQRRCVEMAFFEGLSHSEIATRTGDPLGTIKTRIRSALTYLRRQFSQEEQP